MKKYEFSFQFKNHVFNFTSELTADQDIIIYANRQVKDYSIKNNLNLDEVNSEGIIEAVEFTGGLFSRPLIFSPVII